MLLMIDNFDSFTHNLSQYLSELGEEVLVKRNNEVTLAEIKELQPKALVISPGPCTPNEAGICVAAIQTFTGVVPIFGVCLGLQSLAMAYGASIVRAQKVMHGKTSLIKHNNSGVFAGLNNPLQVTRYHSLVVDIATLPSCFEVTAWTEHEDGSIHEIMGLKHKMSALEGVQFHPESILTQQGHQLLNNFVAPLHH